MGLSDCTVRGKCTVLVRAKANPATCTLFSTHLCSKSRQIETMASTDELACTYSALILADDDIQVTGDKINAILKAANVTVEPFWPTLFARALGGVNIKEMITNIGSAAAAAPAAAGGEEKKEETKKEEKKEESEESDDDMGFGLF